MLAAHPLFTAHRHRTRTTVERRGGIIRCSHVGKPVKVCENLRAILQCSTVPVASHSHSLASLYSDVVMLCVQQAGARSHEGFF